MKKKKIDKILKKWKLDFENLKKNSKTKINELFKENLKISIFGFNKNTEYSTYGELTRDFITQYGFRVLITDQYLSNYDISILKDEIVNSDGFFIVCLTNDSIVAAIELLQIKELNKRKIWILYPEEDIESFTYQNFAQQYGYNNDNFLFSLKSLKDFNSELSIKILNQSLILKWNKYREKNLKNTQIIDTSSIRLGIITALEKEFYAIKYLIEDFNFIQIKKGRNSKIYYHGIINSLQGDIHNVILPLYAGKGNNMAAICATQLINDIPSVEDVIMVGIAGGVPNPQNPEKHVRLGDIVISNEYGVIQYDLIKLKSVNDLRAEHIHTISRPSSSMLAIAKTLKIEADSDNPPWKNYITCNCEEMKKNRPPPELDVLKIYSPKEKTIIHPEDHKRHIGLPRVFLGPIASGNIVVKDELLRDRLRGLFDARAIEMEGAGITDATWSLNARYLIIRGICDYCNQGKNDIWQDYAAIVAASFTRCLIELI